MPRPTGYNFTDRVRKVLQLAREAASRWHQDYVGSERILWGLVGEGSGTAAAVGSSPDLPYASRAKRVLEFAMREAQLLGHNYVGSEHLLLGLLHPEAAPAATLLTTAGLSLDGVRARVHKLRPAELNQPLVDSAGTSRRAMLVAVVALVVALAALVLALRALRTPPSPSLQRR